MILVWGRTGACSRMLGVPTPCRNRHAYDQEPRYHEHSLALLIWSISHISGDLIEAYLTNRSGPEKN